MVKISRTHHRTKKGVIKRNPGIRMYKSIKCSYNTCPNEAVGFYTTSSSGLWLCKDHTSGRLTTTVSDIKKNPNHKSRWQLRENFRNGKVVTQRMLNKEACGKGYCWKNLEEDLKNFDYTYEMSDDFGVWAGGNKKEKEIRAEIIKARKVDRVKTNNLIKKYKQKYGAQF